MKRNSARLDHSLRMACLWALVLAGYTRLPVSVEAWTTPIQTNSLGTFRTTRGRSLFVSRSPNDPSNDSVRNDDDDDNGNKNKKVDHMAVVRQLQDSFYKSAPSTPPCELDAEHAMCHNLPILTWPWHEVPGRSNVLHVHEGTYTHLLETVLRSNPPVWYLGHVYRHGPQTKRRLYSWHDDEKPEPSEVELLHENHRSQETVLGTLLRITDYRRMADGRLLVLVQAMERFAVHNVTQTAPFCVADVQLLPDHLAQQSRSESCLESFGKWHRYEFEQTMLPLPLGAKKKDANDGNEEEQYLDNSQIAGSAMAKVLPYAAFSSVVNVERLSHEQVPTISDEQDEEELYDPLLERSILMEPPLEMDVQQMSCDELEYALWVCLDKYLKQTKRAVSPILLGLLPTALVWPQQFVLERIVTAIQEQDQLDHKCVRVSSEYPAHRRQYRLSYAAAAVLERDEYQAQEWRLQLLQIPTTQERLAFVLQQLRAKTEGGVFQ